MNCAKCDGPLHKKSIGTAEVDQCSKCSGIWFDFNELEEVLKLDNIDALKNQIDNNDGHDDTKATCPKCSGDGNMIQVAEPKNNIKIDTCSVCNGRWLDGGELEKIKDENILKSVIAFFK